MFVASAIAVVLALVLSPRALNLHGLRVANFENYAGIGAASFDNGKKTTAVAYASGGSAGKKDMNLAGITKDNKCQKIEFENEMGKITKQNARLIHFDAYDKFTLFTLTTNKKYEFVESDKQYNNGGYSYRYFSENFALINQYYEYKDTSTLILDNETGKIYDMKEIVGVVQKFVNNKFGFEISFFNFDVNQMNNSVNIEPVGQKSLLMKVFDYSSNTNNNKISIFEAKLTENGVEVKQRMNSIQFDNFTNRSEWDQYVSEVKVSQDIYGNIFVKKNYEDYLKCKEE